MALTIAGGIRFDDPLAVIGDGGETNGVTGFPTVGAACNRHHAFARQINLRQGGGCQCHGDTGVRILGDFTDPAVEVVDFLVVVSTHVPELADIDGISIGCASCNIVNLVTTHGDVAFVNDDALTFVTTVLDGEAVVVDGGVSCIDGVGCYRVTGDGGPAVSTTNGDVVVLDFGLTDGNTAFVSKVDIFVQLNGEFGIVSFLRGNNADVAFCQIVCIGCTANDIDGVVEFDCCRLIAFCIVDIATVFHFTINIGSDGVDDCNTIFICNGNVFPRLDGQGSQWAGSIFFRYRE